MQKKILLILTLFLSVSGFLNAQTNQLLYQYNFDGNLYDVNNLNGFTLSIGSSPTFTTNRNNEANKAIRLNNAGIYALLSYLPFGNNSRSISMWVAVNAIATDNYLFQYGTEATNQAYGFSLTSSQINNYGWGNDMILSNYTFPINTWKHVVATYNQANGLACMYIDNVLVKSATKTAWNTTASALKLGAGYSNSFNGSIDDLKIYNYALNATEVSNLYNYNTEITPAPITKRLLYQFDFDGNRTDALSSVGFDNNGTFVNDRNNNPAKALNLNSAGIKATLANLPLANNSRTVSMWFKANSYLVDNFLFAYGVGSSNQAYGVSYSPSNFNNYGWSNDMVYGVTTQPMGVWRHLVVTYNKTTGLATMYINGNLVKSETKTAWNTGNDTLFRIGYSLSSNLPDSSLDCAIDDLKIYNYDLTTTEVNQLYTYNMLSLSDFNQNNLKVTMYPNPVHDILNIDIENEIKLVEIYNPQGQKVKTATTKQINVNDLKTGAYLIKIQNQENQIATKKFVKL